MLSRFYSTIRGLRRSHPELFWDVFAPAWVETVETIWPTPHAPGSSVYDVLKYAGAEVRDG